MRRGKRVTELSKQRAPPRSVTANPSITAASFRDGDRPSPERDLQDEYQAWLEALPQNMEDSATAEALRTICDLDLSELERSPRGFGRD